MSDAKDIAANQTTHVATTNAIDKIIDVTFLRSIAVTVCYGSVVEIVAQVVNMQVRYFFYVNGMAKSRRAEEAGNFEACLEIAARCFATFDQSAIGPLAAERSHTMSEGNVKKNDSTRAFEAMSTLFPALWTGMIVGVSFIATPAKFLAPSLGARAAFDVGRSTFELFNSIEVVLAIVLLAIALYRENRALVKLVAASLFAITVIQALVVLPVLSDRVSAIIAGYGVAPSYAHTLYGLMEVMLTPCMG